MTLLLGMVLLFAAIALAGGALESRQPSGLERSLQALEEVSAAPQEVAAEAERPFSERVVAPLQARSLIIGRRITGADQAARLRHKLDVAGNPMDWSVDRVIALKVLAAITVPVVMVMYGLIIGASATWLILLGVGGLVIGFFGPDLFLYNLAQKRSQQIRRSLADAVDLLTISVEAGLGFDAALQQVARKTRGPVAEEFARLVREMQLGLGRSEALRALADRSDVAELQSFVGAMVQADAFGVPVGQVLRVQSSEMRVKRRQNAEARAQQVPVKIMVPLVICILPCLFVVVMAPAALSAMEAFSS